MKKLIKDCTIITMVEHDQPYVGDILIEDDIIMDIGSNLQTEADQEIQGGGTKYAKKNKNTVSKALGG